MISCSQSQKDKVNALIQESVRKSLAYPESYKPLETVVDSAFAPFDDPVFYEKTLEICKLNIEEYSDSLSGRIQKCGQELIDMMGLEYRFIGYKVTHTFDMEGVYQNNTRVFILDKDMTSIIAEYDADSPDYIMVQTMYKLWRDESVNSEDQKELVSGLYNVCSCSCY
jgi:hypothetical protein